MLSVIIGFECDGTLKKKKNHALLHPWTEHSWGFELT